MNHIILQARNKFYKINRAWGDGSVSETLATES